MWQQGRAILAVGPGHTRAKRLGASRSKVTGLGAPAFPQTGRAVQAVPQGHDGPVQQLHYSSPPDTSVEVRRRRVLILAVFAALCVHVCVFLALGQIVLFDTQERGEEIVFAAKLLELPRPEPAPGPPAPPRVQEAEAEVKAPAEAPAERGPEPAMPQPEPEKAQATAPAAGATPAPSSPYGARGDAAGKGRALKEFGGTAMSENAVQLGLEWLARHQEDSGCWSGGKPGAEPALTGLALMAFLGAGHTPTQGHFAANAKRGLAWLVHRQGADGLIGPKNLLEMYCHGIASLAVAEAACMTHDPSLRPVLEQAVSHIVRAQQEQGGWDYQSRPTGRNDTSVTCWQIMALLSARRAGARVPRETLRGLIQHLDRVTRMSGKVQYLQQHGHSSSALAAAAVFCRLLLGWDRKSPVVRRCTSSMRPRLPSWEQARDKRIFPLYYWYYGTLAMFQMGKPYWPKWNTAMREMLVKTQCKEGDDRGSWPPVGRDGRYGGRVYATAIGVLNLEIYYRYLPLHQARDAVAVEVLLPELVDKSGRVQGDVVTQLISIGPASAPALIDVLTRCSESGRARIVQFLCSVPMTPDIEKTLLGCLNEGDPLWSSHAFVRVKAAGALAARRHAAAIGPLCVLAAEPNDFVRSQAVEALGFYDTPEALAALVAALADPRAFVVNKALAALVRHSGRQDFGLNPDLPVESRTEAIQKWREWLQARQPPG